VQDDDKQRKIHQIGDVFHGFLRKLTVRVIAGVLAQSCPLQYEL
jgi:hypothetical protein